MPQSVELVLWCVVLVLVFALAVPIVSVARHGRANLAALLLVGVFLFTRDREDEDRS